MKGKDGNWDAYYSKETRDADLGKNGRLSYGGLGNIVFMYLRRPDDISLERLQSDSKLFMDLILGMARAELAPTSCGRLLPPPA
jgi:hypothetical protein